MLHCAARSVLISGDQLLSQISTNILVIAIDPLAEPLSEWLASRQGDRSIAHGLPSNAFTFAAMATAYESVIPETKSVIPSTRA